MQNTNRYYQKLSAEKNRAKSTDREAMISLHDFVAVTLTQSEGLGKMALGIVKII